MLLNNGKKFFTHVLCNRTSTITNLVPCYETTSQSMQPYLTKGKPNAYIWNNEKTYGLEKSFWYISSEKYDNKDWTSDKTPTAIYWCINLSNNSSPKQTTLDDYTVDRSASNILTSDGAIFRNSSSSGRIIDYKRVFKNETDSPITVTEVSLSVRLWMKMSSIDTYFQTEVLIAKEVLNSPIIIHPGEKHGFGIVIEP